MGRRPGTATWHADKKQVGLNRVISIDIKFRYNLLPKIQLQNNFRLLVNGVNRYRYNRLLLSH